MKRHSIAPVAAAVSLLFAGAALAEEVNPFAGAHGSVEALRLETEKTHQQNQLLKEKIELLRNQMVLSNGGIDIKPMAEKAPPVKEIEHEKAPPALSPAPVKPAPPPKIVLTGVIDTATGRQAIVTQGGRNWTLSLGDKLGRATVKRIDSSQMKLSNGQVLHLAPSDHPVAGGGAGTLASVGGGMSDELNAIMRITGPKPSLPVINPNPVPAKIN